MTRVIRGVRPPCYDLTTNFPLPQRLGWWNWPMAACWAPAGIRTSATAPIIPMPSLFRMTAVELGAQPVPRKSWAGNAHLRPCNDGSAFFVYNQRKHGRVGVWLASARPTDGNFNTVSNDLVWAAQSAPSANGHGEWTQFTFGEPSVTVLGDGSVF